MAMPVVHHDGDRYIRTITYGQDDASGSRCIGSRCAMWVPTMAASGNEDPCPRSAYGLADGHLPTGTGTCADNIRAVPWADPAAKDR